MTPPRAGLHLAIERATYPITGSTSAEIRTLLHTLGPTRNGCTFAAFTDWEVSWTYSVAPLPEGVHLAAARVDVRALVTVPRWRPPRSALAALIARWRQYRAAIELHEQGHVNLAVDAGRCVLARLETLPAFPSEQELQRAVDAAARAEIAAALDRERVYDEASGHGASQGVHLDGDPPA
jgi:predicted secreted Zn-dependent protease